MTVMNSNIQPGMSAATGSVVGRAPAFVESIQPTSGGNNISNVPEERPSWKQASKKALAEYFKFVMTPTGFLITIYGLNIMGWGAMLGFLAIDAAPAMDYPNKDDVNSPRKIWIEIDSQILNALFCVAAFGLAPWRVRDLYWSYQAQFRHDHYAMKQLYKQNETWFRPPTWYQNYDVESGQKEEQRVTTTGDVAPPTSLWKLSFVAWMMVLNTVFQAGLAVVMWRYNRINRPWWATGTFVGLAGGVVFLAGMMIWWEARRIKKIEGPAIIKAAEDDEPSKVQPQVELNRY